MHVLITGADGFIGQNLAVQLAELKQYTVLKFTRNNSLLELRDLVNQSDFIFHLAGVNRSLDPVEFKHGNIELTEFICQYIAESGRKIPVVFSSSTQAELDNHYGKSKLAAEEFLHVFHQQHANPVFIYRLTNVFGKWSRPDYNSVVATFCHNIANDLPITVNNQSAPLDLVYVDDVVATFINLLAYGSVHLGIYQQIPTRYSTTVGEVAEIIYSFKESIKTGVVPRVGTGLIRALYATYLTFLPPKNFSYSMIRHEDPRGVFVEMLKTHECGQISFFTAYPGVTRGGHYHHTKTEKFLVIKGIALYRFRQIITGEYYEVIVNSMNSMIVETIPGWAHDITNIGQDELIVMLWANEIFNHEKPDTISFKI